MRLIVSHAREGTCLQGRQLCIGKPFEKGKFEAADMELALDNMDKKKNSKFQTL